MPPVFPDILISPARVLSGAGTAARLLHEAAVFGGRGILAHGSSHAATVNRLLAAAPHGQAVLAWQHPGGEPTLDQVDDLICSIRKHKADWVAAIGGGSVLDAAKAAAGLARSGKDLEFYHNGGAIGQPGLPFLAVPTTAGTGSEATLNAVLTNLSTGRKQSIRDDSLMPRTVILDPLLLASLPRRVIAHSGLDALTQAMEAYVSRHATWWSDQLCIEAMRLLAGALPLFHANPAGPQAMPMLQGSFLAGMALSMARLGIVHGLAHPLGVRMHAPHGLVCAICLPLALEFNREAIGNKYQAMAAALAADPLEKVTELLRCLDVVSPFQGRTLPQRDAIIDETLASGSTKANPRAVSKTDVAWFLDRLEQGSFE